MKTVFFDVDTQIDFLFPAGALYVPKAERIVGRVAELNHWAASRAIPVVSTTDAHSENDVEFRRWPPHCVSGTTGQLKAQATLLERRTIIPNRACPVAVDGAQQIILEKVTTDCFLAVNTMALLDVLQAERYVVYGVAADVCVRHAIFGLLRTGRRVELVTGAIEGIDAMATASMIAEFQSLGGKITDCATILAD